MTARYRPAQWRVLNLLRNRMIHGKTTTLSEACNIQGCSLPDLCVLDEAGLLSAALSETPIKLAHVNPTRAGLPISLHLTPRGRHFVLTDPRNVLLLTLEDYGRGGRQVRHVRGEAQVDDAQLIDMAQQGWIGGFDRQTGDVPLNAFRRLPDELMIRLTAKAELFLPGGAAR